MSEFKGTQGRWSVFQKATKINGDDRVGIIGSKDKKPMMVCIITDNEETQANSLLISKAPEMLEILVHLLSLKHAKDLDGKTPYYIEEMPKAWEKAQQLIKQSTEI